jgi:hypothetical protein
MYVLPLHSPPGHVPAASLAVLTVESSRFRYQFPVPLAGFGAAARRARGAFFVFLKMN